MYYLQGFLWSRRESNSGPNKQLKGFLHVYFLIEFSIMSQARNSHSILISFISKSTRSLWKSRFKFTIHLYRPL
ncbi:MAG: hypothetical protein ACI8W0_000959 [Flavobacterium sp.]|jgi:hypothetical protein